MRRIIVAVFVSALAFAGPALAANAAKPPKPPKQAASAVTISASPTTVVFGSTTSITGQATGNKAAGATVELQDQKSAGQFATVMSATADATGHYMFKVTPTQNTVYRVVAHTAPQATSQGTAVKVLVKVTFGVSTTTPKAGSKVRFFGFVLPAYNGKLALIQRQTASGWKTVARTGLVAATPLGGVARSKYSKRLLVRASGTYRVYFNPSDGLRQPNASSTKRLRVH